MRDQATELRNLVLRSMRQQSTDTIPGPRTLVLTGGQSGVGVTTLAVHLAAAWADLGARVVLIDADVEQGKIAQYCGIEPQHTIADVLSARRDIHEVLQRGSTGVQVLPGANHRHACDLSALAVERLLRQTRSLVRHADVVLIDAGASRSFLLERFWSTSQSVVLTTTTDNQSIMNTYALIKGMHTEATSSELLLAVNHSADDRASQDVHRRMAQSCQRFLQLPLTWLGAVPHAEDMRSPASGDVLAAAFTSMATMLATETQAALRPAA